MKIDRLIGILSILLQKEDVTATYLAERFEVSKRTITRDIDSLGRAGIPVVTRQGKNGGISIMEGYGIDRTLLTYSEMKAILAGLDSLDSISGSKRYQQLMSKLAADHDSALPNNKHIRINLSSWYKSTLAPKFELIQEAIDKAEYIRFTYYSPKGESKRVLEPYFLMFQWSSWYVWGYCQERKDFRMFKLNRMDLPEKSGKNFRIRQLPEISTAPEHYFPQSKIEVCALFEPGMKWRLIEEYGMESYEEQEDGKLLFRHGFVDGENVLSWVLSFGQEVELLEPRELRSQLLEVAKKIGEKYER
ncbi:MAG TPA: YafY family transcriptional regulator [Candidatus Pelethocola excrementipullorum]|nr:YafY family transcriptional regulator [Candidatus Pelethocola excrementipullorum]